jgi:hypothetical protein
MASGPVGAIGKALISWRLHHRTSGGVPPTGAGCAGGVFDVNCKCKHIKLH